MGFRRRTGFTYETKMMHTVPGCPWLIGFSNDETWKSYNSSGWGGSTHTSTPTLDKAVMILPSNVASLAALSVQDITFKT